MRTENASNSEKILPDAEIIDLYWNRDEKAIEATDLLTLSLVP